MNRDYEGLPLSAQIEAAHPHNFHPKYRPDIDGLRAVAVLAVVLFHAFPKAIVGGFIGVDIFFVISGYLISTIIFQSLDRGEFSALEFYGRRVKRIFPALIAVLLACYVSGWFALLADELQQLGKHMLGGATFSANIWLWAEVGYFDTAAETKPLLHLWSLAIEEQFYIVWPALLWFFYRLNWRAGPAMLLIAIASLVYSVYATHTNPTAAFYSPLARSWELLAGALLAYTHLYHPSWLARFRQWQSMAGIALIIAGFALIDETLAFPGLWALLPIGGAVLLISAGPIAWLNRHILAAKIMVWIGVISYPLYLWHWPLLSFARIIESGTPSSRTRNLALVLSFVLAWLTYKLIEKPIRGGNSARAKIAALAGIMVITGTLGAVAYLQQGYAFRNTWPGFQSAATNREQLEWSNAKSAGCADALGADSAFCVMFGNQNQPTMAIIGDSSGNSLAPGFASIQSGPQDGLVNFGHWTCPPIRGIGAVSNWGEGERYDCQAITKKSYEFIKSHPSIKTVVLAILARDMKSWNIPELTASASLDERFAVIQERLNQDIADLGAQGIRVIVTYDMPVSPVSARNCIDRPFKIGKNKSCNVTADKLEDRDPYIGYWDRMFKDRTDVCVFRQSDLMLQNGKLAITDADGKLLIRDSFHLSNNGSAQMATLFKKSTCYQP